MTSFARTFKSTCARSLARSVPTVVVALASVVATASPALSQSAADTSWNTLRSAFRTYTTSDSIVGASLVTMRHGLVLGRDNVGFGDRALREPITDATLYHWGSITKTLTAIAIMQLRDRGKLRLDDRITQYLPELRQVHSAFGSMDDITLRMLMSHSAGTRNGTWPYSDDAAWQPFEPTRWEQLVAMMPYQQLNFAPGSRYGYSNPGFIYLARVIEQLTGDPWIHYIQKNIWAPLGLTHSYVNTTPYHLAADRSNNYTVRRDSLTGTLAVVANGRDFDPGITIPNGGWNAPVGDLVTYAAFLTNATGDDATRRRLFDTILSRRSLDEMWTAIVPLDAAHPQAGAMGLSFFLYERGAERVIGHTGSQAGFRAFLYFNPRSARAVIAAYNTSSNVELPGARANERALNEAMFRYLSLSK